jgi:hypothetical protein
LLIRSQKIWVWDPGSGIRKKPIPDSGSRIQGSKRHWIPDPDLQHCLEGVCDKDEGQPAQDPVLPVQQAEPWTQLRFQQLLYLKTISLTQRFDPDPGSSAFLTLDPVSGMVNIKVREELSGSNSRELRNNFWVKNFMWFRIRDPESF